MMAEQERLSLEQRLTLGTSNRLKLGLFGANQSGGVAGSTLPDRWTADWQQNVDVAQLADRGGLDFLLPVARWKGYGGKTDPAGTSHETIAWASGLLAKTNRITIFATVHSTLLNPVFAAKQFATIDHIGAGRLGLNVVVGWNEEEFEMFGVAAPRESRYPYSREWVDCVKRLWSATAEFDYDGDYLKLQGLRGRPGPFGDSRPIIVNAGMSEIGQSFAVDCCDALFSTPPSGDYQEFAGIISAMKRRAAGRGVPYPVYTHAAIICRPTRREAEEFAQHCQENMDWEAIDIMLDIRVRSGKVVPEGTLQERRLSMLKGFGGFKFTGDPDHVAEEIRRLSEVGIDGLAMTFFNQLRDVPYFLQEVEPRLKRMELRS